MGRSTDFDNRRTAQVSPRFPVQVRAKKSMGAQSLDDQLDEFFDSVATSQVDTEVLCEEYDSESDPE